MDYRHVSPTTEFPGLMDTRMSTGGPGRDSRVTPQTESGGFNPDSDYRPYYGNFYQALKTIRNAPLIPFSTEYLNH